ncbi:MAG: LysR family transcriptional regulator [Devosia sp.]
MDRLDSIRMFVRVVESGSFSAVALEAGVGQPAVSKQIAALEAHLGAQLLRRTSRSMTLTDAGQTFYESAIRVVGELEAAESAIGRGQATPSGLVRVSTAPVFGRHYIVPRLPEFFVRFPDVSVELSISERVVNLVEDGIDLAIRVGGLTDSSMIAKRLAATSFVLVATPAYLDKHGTPATPADLDRHLRVVYAPHGEARPWEFMSPSGPVTHYPKGNFRTADAENIRTATLSGLGLALAPAYMFAAEISSGAVRIVLSEYPSGALAISAVHAAGRRLPTKVRVFLDFLTEAFARDPALASGYGGGRGEAAEVAPYPATR